MAVSDALGDRRGRAAALHLIAMVEERRFHWDTAISLFEEELAIWRELGEARPMGLALWLLSGALYSRGDVVQARAAVDEAAAIFRQIGHRYWEVMSLSYLGMFAATEGRFAEAVHHYRASLGGLAGLGEVTFFHKPLPALAELALVGGDPTNAARLLGAVDVRVERTGSPVMPFDVPMYERAHAGAAAALGEQAFATARAEGRELSTEDLLVLADAVVDAVEAAARVQGRRRAASAGGLTPREQEVVRLIATGKTDAEIADALFVSRRTVNAHVANILGKLGVSSRGDAVAHARDLGLLASSATSSRYT
jgi:DNA-binding CsgD family transcriptional regulator